MDNTFKTNQLTVNYSQVADLFVLSNGMTVNITGIIHNRAPSVLHAESINLAASIVDNNGEVIHVEGFITYKATPAEFSTEKKLQNDQWLGRCVATDHI
ncbi:MAG: hypothetical protein ACI9D5_001984 [Candidatus Endobugula sp.]|jgi:hypothetical protein